MSSLKNNRHFTTLPLVSCEMPPEKRAQEFHHYPDLGSVSDSSFRGGKFASTNQKQKHYPDLGSVASPVSPVSDWRHGGHFGSKEQNFFPPIGIKLLFRANWWGKTGRVMPRFTDIRLKRTPHHYGQFSLFLGKENLYIYGHFLWPPQCLY